jgi:arabinofuranan 3-O-arabinosyltransferase
VDALDVTPTPQAAAPRTIVVTTPVGSTQVQVPARGGVVRFTPMATDTVTIEFVKSTRTVGRVPAFGAAFVMPVGLKALSIPALGAVHAAAPTTTATVDIPCGQGPSISLDGHLLQTAVTGTSGDLLNLQPMHLRVCGGALAVSKGAHLLEAGSANGAFKVTTVTAAPAMPAPSTHTSARTARIVGTWGPQSRTVQVGAGGSTYLTVAQNFNAGWHATLHGRTLESVRLDGWEQGWIVPAGGAGVVTMTYTPDTWYRAPATVRAGRGGTGPDRAGPRHRVGFARPDSSRPPGPALG